MLKDIGKKQTENSKHKVNKHQAPYKNFHFYKETRDHNYGNRNENIIQVKSLELLYMFSGK
ncbi:hypothetical protein CIN01S_02_01620 [Chryseobacterium indologenes NBRC 14944]|nr:hypothetical protein CIN01S_02_01620 [Chryseobacterium indologenes NBRC 14944]